MDSRVTVGASQWICAGLGAPAGSCAYGNSSPFVVTPPLGKTIEIQIVKEPNAKRFMIGNRRDLIYP